MIYLIGLFLIAGQLTLLPPDYAFGETDSQSASASGDTILAFTSDVHNNNDDVSADRLARWIGRIQSKYGKIDAMGFCGGYPDEEKDRVTGNASDVIDLLNKAATNETPDDPSDDRKIIFLWGHNFISNCDKNNTD